MVEFLLAQINEWIKFSIFVTISIWEKKLELFLRYANTCKSICSVAKHEQRYADSIAERSDKYGTALLYYAKAHCVKKVKDVLDLLISLSLVQSLAFPPISSLDHNLNAFLSSPEKSLDEIANSDPKAAEILHRYLTGYATLRKFYDLRDEEVNLEVGKKPSLRPIARKRAAVVALLAVIDSAADNIHGGLYDEQRGSVVQVDGLLTLLGEAVVFVDRMSPLSMASDVLISLFK